MVTVGDFLDYCIDEGLLTVEIYSCEKCEIVWLGNGYDVPDEYLNAELGSWDVPSKADHITLNIE